MSTGSNRVDGTEAQSWPNGLVWIEPNQVSKVCLAPGLPCDLPRGMKHNRNGCFCYFYDTFAGKHRNKITRHQQLVGNFTRRGFFSPITVQFFPLPCYNTHGSPPAHWYSPYYHNRTIRPQSRINSTVTEQEDELKVRHLIT